MNKMFVVRIECDDYGYVHFVTDSRRKANKWAKRFNKIIAKTAKRLEKYEWKENNPFWFDFVMYYNPMAFIEEVERR